MKSILPSPQCVTRSVLAVAWGSLRPFLADRVGIGEQVSVFVRPPPGFRLPALPDAPVIMIGPGTGIAPFRAFLQERRALGASGRIWLFFGNPRRRCDFLFEEELTGYCRDGFLTRLDLAFSRDQEDKVYVQHRLLKHAAELWSWLAEGGLFTGHTDRHLGRQPGRLHRPPGNFLSPAAAGWRSAPKVSF